MLFEPNTVSQKTDEQILQTIRKLILAHKQGLLGGEKMPEDARPILPLNSEQNLLYLTLPMSLNYQRNSYKLWESALLTWQNEQTNFVFEPKKVIDSVNNFGTRKLKETLVKYKVALQPNKQPEIWLRICKTIEEKYNGKLINLLQKKNFDIALILEEIQKTNKIGFPYLSGNKIANYWLYVLTQYTDFPFINKQKLSIAPDTHVLQASVRLELSTINHSPLQVAQKWQNLLVSTDISPIDIHTPLWLWSRSGFKFDCL